MSIVLQAFFLKMPFYNEIEDTRRGLVLGVYRSVGYVRIC